ncbi:MAG: 16S rRNA (uracil(1498)-N(3))-methyltransferase [Deltaproteobacteria bacterium]|nr:16S rRNA (uracil(1498)-N(3))-methyltransferase [Deltaproteobacteria bacterium]
MAIMAGIGQIITENACLEGSFLLTKRNFQNLILWKPRLGEAVTICNADNKFFRARIAKLESDAAEVKVFEELNQSVESNLNITLVQAIPEKERMELIIQKATELGASSIVPFKSERSISLEERDAIQKKSHKWGEIALKAAKQSRRATIPQIQPYCNFADAIKATSSHEFKLLLWENEKANLLKEKIRAVKGLGVKNVSVMIGPEGGFALTEIEEAKEAGFISVGLGARVLRTETAAITMIGLIQYELGNLG